MSSVFVVSNALRLRLFKPSGSPTASEASQEGERLIEENLPTTVIGVEGMMCGHCTAAVEKACKGVPGVLAATADLDGKKVTVRGEADRNALETAIVDAGYSIFN